MSTETIIMTNRPKLLIFDWHGTLADNSGDLFPRVASTLAVLKRSNFTLALATSMPQARILALLEENNLHNCFSAIQTGDMEYQKPDPQMLLTILELTQHNAADAVMIGDSISDIVMAHEAQLVAIGVLSGCDSKHALEIVKPLAILESVNDLLNLLQVN